MNNLKKFQTFNEIIEQQHENLGTVKTFLSRKGCAKIIRKVAAKKKLHLPKKQSYAPTELTLTQITPRPNLAMVSLLRSFLTRPDPPWPAFACLATGETFTSRRNALNPLYLGLDRARLVFVGEHHAQPEVVQVRNSI